MTQGPALDDYLAARQTALLRTAWLLTGDWQLAEDLLQTALVKLWPRWETIRRGGDPEAYVRRTLVTTFATSRRRRWRAEVPTPELPEPAAGSDSFAAADLRRALARLLVELPPRQRAVIVLRYYDDLTEVQVAAALGVSVGTVKSQASKALARLRASVDAEQIMREPR